MPHPNPHPQNVGEALHSGLDVWGDGSLDMILIVNAAHMSGILLGDTVVPI